MKSNTGTAIKNNGKWVARISYRDALGNRKYITRVPPRDSRTAAKSLIPGMLEEFEYLTWNGPRVRVESFDHLARFYREHYLVAPKYVGDRKVSGARSYRNQRYQLDEIAPYFTGLKLRDITHGTLKRFRELRLDTPLKSRKKEPGEDEKPKQRSIASVNREMAMLRMMFSIAKTERWIKESPFKQGGSLISEADEVKRIRCLSKSEEMRLLLACSESVRSCVKEFIILALDTGARAGELFTLKWSDLNLEAPTITIRSTNTKTQTERSVPVTLRVKTLLESMFVESEKRLSRREFVLPRASVKKTFGEARKAAGLIGAALVRPHDLRHTCATRLIESGMSLPEVGRILGHTRPETTYRYVNAHAGTVARAAELLDSFNQKAEEELAVN